MKIIIFAGFYKPHVGGYEKNVHEFARRLVTKGHIVQVITCNTLVHLKTISSIDGVHVLYLPTRMLMSGTFPLPKLDRRGRFYLKTLFGHRSRYDVVITQTRFFSTSLLGYIFAKYKRIPLIHVERGSYHSMTDRWQINLLARLYDHTIGALIISAARNVSISDSVKRFVKHLGKDSVVIPNGIDIPAKSYDNHNGINVTYIGRLIYAKGVQDLIAAFKMLSVKARLLIAGDGNYREQLEKLAAGNGTIKFLGIKDKQGIIDMLSITDVFVNPSYSEGLPTSVMEAASMGVPIIATDVGGTREIIKHNQSGILIKPHNIAVLSTEIQSLIANPDKASRLGQSAKAAMKDYNWNDIMAKWDKLLKEVTL